MQYDEDDRYPRPPTPGRRRADSRHEDDAFRGRGQGIPFAPEVPGSPTETFSSSSSGSRTVLDHWLPTLFNQGQPPATPLPATGQAFVILAYDTSKPKLISLVPYSMATPSTLTFAVH